MKWAYLSIDKIQRCKFTKLVAIGNDQEMDVYVDNDEDQKNYSAIAAHYKTGKAGEILDSYGNTIWRYKPKGKNEVEQSLAAMKDIGPVLIYSYYVERFLEPKQSERRARILLALNSRLRDSGAKIVYTLYNKAWAALVKKYRTAAVDWLVLNECGRLPEENTMEERKKFYAFFGTAHGSIVFTGEAAQKFLAREKFTEVKEVIVAKTQVTGLPASGGNVRGRVKIVRGLKDMKRCVGNVVVSRDVVIEYTSLLKRNLAIVTDLGGICSHAAVTAREFKIPCVVGTKIATKVLKDGDMVEVDANTGTVKIIKRSKG